MKDFERETTAAQYALRGPLALFSKMFRSFSTSTFISACLQTISRKASRITGAATPARDQLLEFEKRHFSQHGEDGILKELCFRLGLRRGTFVEFGVQDPMVCNTTLFALVYGWSGFYIDYTESSAFFLNALYSSSPRIHTAKEFLTADNIASIFKNIGVPTEFDILSIDVDGNDYWLWNALSTYRPKLVVIEYNGAYPPPTNWIMAHNPTYEWDGSSYFGASLVALDVLGRRLGYSLIGTESRGVNAFFLRSDLVLDSGFVGLTAESAYRRPRYGFTGLPYPFKPGPSCKAQ